MRGATEQLLVAFGDMPGIFHFHIPTAFDCYRKERNREKHGNAVVLLCHDLVLFPMTSFWRSFGRISSTAKGFQDISRFSKSIITESPTTSQYMMNVTRA